jgi:dihydroorotase
MLCWTLAFRTVALRRSPQPADTVLDVAGLYVTPGLIDLHVHVYPLRGETGPTWQASLVPDAHSFRAGVTTFVDAGTCGAEHFPD